METESRRPQVDAEACKATLFVLTAQLVKRAASVELALPKGTHGARVKRADAQKAKFLARCRDALAAGVRWDVVRCVVLCGRGADGVAAFFRDDATPAAACSADADAVGHLRRAATGGRLCVAPATAAPDVSRDALRAVLAEPAVAKRIEQTAAARYCAALEALEAQRRRDADRVLSGSLDAAAAARAGRAASTASFKTTPGQRCKSHQKAAFVSPSWVAGASARRWRRCWSSTRTSGARRRTSRDGSVFWNSSKPPRRRAPRCFTSRRTTSRPRV